MISAYHDMPYAIFRYSPEEEFAVRRRRCVCCKTRLERAGKSVTTVSLSECLATALEAEGMDARALAQAEVSVGLDKTIETAFEIISSYQRLDTLVVERIHGSGPASRRRIHCARWRIIPNVSDFVAARTVKRQSECA